MNRHLTRAPNPPVDFEAFRTAALAGTATRRQLATLVRFASEDGGLAATDDTRTVTFVLSDGSVDSYNTTLNPNGWDFDRSGAGTILLYGHDPSDPANVVGRVHNIRVENNKLLGDAVFMTGDVNPRAEAVYRMVCGGFINSCSVGFDPVEWVRSASRKDGIDFKRQELLEVSVVAIPSNKNALAQARAAGIDVDKLDLPEPQTRDRVCLTRDMYDLQSFASLMQSLAYVTKSTAWEADYEGDGSDVPARLCELLKAAGAIMVDMTAEEVGELIAGVTGETERSAGGLAFMRALQKPEEAAPRYVIRTKHALSPDQAAAVERKFRQWRDDPRQSPLVLEPGIDLGTVNLRSGKIAFLGDVEPSPLQRAGKVVSAANEASLREAHGLISRAAEMVLGVAGANASDEDATEPMGDDADTRAKADEAARLRRARALQLRAKLPGKAA